MSRELAPVLRILTPDASRWVGCAFLVPGPPGSTDLHAATCAHVVAEALGDPAIGHNTTAPGGSVVVHFASEERALRVPIRAVVVPEAWRPTPDAVDAAAGPIDIAILRLDLQDRPASAGYPQLRAEAIVDTPVFAYGPEYHATMSADDKAQWVDGSVKGQARPGQISFLAGDEIQDNRVIGGYSGGPLTDRQSFEVVGMVRSVKTYDQRRAFAIPLDRLAEVWPPLGLDRRRARNRVDRVFDLIDRNDQVTLANTHLRDQLVPSGTPGFTVVVAGPREEDHAHFRRRLAGELGQHGARGGQIVVADIDPHFARHEDSQKQLDMILENLAAKTKAAGRDPDEIVAAMDRGAEGWLVQIAIEADLSAQDGAVLADFMDVWDLIADRTAAEVYLCLSFVFCPDREATAPAAAVKDRIIAHHSTPIRLAPLAPVEKGDIIRWADLIVQRGLMPDDRAEDLSYDVEDLFGAEQVLSMRDLRRAISRAKLQTDETMR